MATTNSNAIHTERNIAPKGGSQQVVVDGLGNSETLNTATSLQTAADKHRLLSVPNGARLFGFWIDFADLDTNATETIDLDVIAEDDDGNTVLFNGGTSFESAFPTTDGAVFFAVEHSFNAKNSGVGYISLLVVTKAATGVAAAEIRFTAIWQ